jgi:hypothetical protein
MISSKKVNKLLNLNWHFLFSIEPIFQHENIARN